MFLVLSGIVSGCGTMANGRGWGQDATFAPGWDRVKQAAWKAATAPATWVPAAGAVAFQIDRADWKVEKWAARETPVFDSRENASRMSDNLLDASGVIWVISAVATPSGDTAGDWSAAKAKGLGVQTAGGILTRGTAGYLKKNITRGRCNGNGNDNDCFTSAHASGAAMYATFASRNIETLGWSSGAVTASKIGLGVMTAATAWARVEASFHYPTDVLVGIAIGHFFGAFFTDAFMGLDNPRNTMVLIEPSRDGVTAMIRFNF
jgi:membrane-associated phospholipid phosphatase